MNLNENDLYAVWHERIDKGQVGHTHFWDRALSRRRLFGTALASGIALGLPALAPTVAQAKKAVSLPNAILGGTQLGPFFKHFYFPTLANPVNSTSVVANGTGDPSTIRDFTGELGLAEFPPTGVVSGDPLGGVFWAADVRFMRGRYVGRDDARHRATFAFI